MMPILLPKLLVYIMLALTALVLIILCRLHKMAMFSELVDPLGEFGDMPLNTATTATATTTTYHSDYPTQSQHTIGIITNSTGWKYFNSPKRLSQVSVDLLAGNASASGPCPSHKLVGISKMAPN
jgi:hypothetical protein